MSIGKKLTLYVLMFSGVFTIIGTTIQLFLDYKNELKGVDATFSLIEKSHINSLSQNVWSLDLPLVETQLAEIMNLPDIVYLDLQLKDMQPIQKGSLPEPSLQILHHYSLTYHTGFDDREVNVGTLQVAVTLENIYAELMDKLLIILLTQAIKVFCVSFFIMFLFYLLVTRHLEKISRFLAATTLNSLSEPLKIETSKFSTAMTRQPDELSILVNAINSMRVELNQEIEAKRITELQLRQEIRDHRQTEQALRRSQKMDAIGQMAGGIAHDFNNILGVILGNLSFLKRQVRGDEKALKRVDTSNKAALRAADLTRQLLGFSRRQAEKIQVTDVKKLILDMDDLIARSVTPEVEVEYRLLDNIWRCEIDPGELEDAMLNLVLNAKDAMPKGGKLNIALANKILDEGYTQKQVKLKPGEYVELSVSDTGCGIAKSDQERIFEPFFTTKEKGKGTGLGMSMVFGFIQRSHGHVKLYSELGIGTTIRIYLPRSRSTETPPSIWHDMSEELPHGTESILIVDDEPELIEVATQYLQPLGYTIYIANDGKQALEILSRYPELQLLFSDVVMPGGSNGYELAERAKQLFPALKVLLTSGYTDRAPIDEKNAPAQVRWHLLNKPYNQTELAQRIRELLDAEG